MRVLIRSIVYLTLLSAILYKSLPAYAEVNDYVCGALRNAYGPFDFRSDKDKLPIVEGAHLTPDVENLVKGNTGTIGGDLDYTLRAFPNHPRALMSMVRLGERTKRSRPQGAHYSVECYLHRAIRFRDDDATVKMIYATFLAKNGKPSEALKQLSAAVELGVDGANIQYNIGLVYFDLQDFDKALEYAHVAYKLGYPLPGLRDKLKRIGKWKEISPGESNESNFSTSESNSLPK